MPGPWWSRPLSLAAAGLDPRVLNPGLASVQEAVRARPDVEQLLLIVAVLSAIVLLVGGVLGDTDGRRGSRSALSVPWSLPV